MPRIEILYLNCPHSLHTPSEAYEWPKACTDSCLDSLQLMHMYVAIPASVQVAVELVSPQLCPFAEEDSVFILPQFLHSYVLIPSFLQVAVSEIKFHEWLHFSDFSAQPARKSVKQKASRIAKVRILTDNFI